MAIELEVLSRNEAVKKDLSLMQAALAKMGATADKLGAKLAGLKVGDPQKTAAMSNNMAAIDKSMRSTVVSSEKNAIATQSASKALATMPATSAATSKNMAATAKQTENVSTAAQSASKSFNGMSLAIGSAVAGLGALQLANVADGLTNVNNRLALVSNGAADMTSSLKAVRDVAMTSRMEIAGVANLYGKLAMASANLGASQKDIMIVTQTAARAVAVSGSNASEAASAFLQLGQALGSGRLQGDELRSITENALGLSSAIAAGLGVTIGEMRSLGEQSLLTSKLVFDALLYQGDAVNAKFKKIGVTFSQAFTNIGNASVVTLDAIGKALQLRGGASFLNNLAVGLYKFAANVEYYFVVAEAYVVHFGATVERVFKNIVSPRLPKINIEAFMPGIDVAVKYVKTAVVLMERSFFWLYDQVVGNSWFPDMVLGVQTWAAKLVGVPLAYIKSFTSRAVDQFVDLYDMSKAILIKLSEIFVSVFRVVMVPIKYMFGDLFNEIGKAFEQTSLWQNFRKLFDFKPTWNYAHNEAAPKSLSTAFQENRLVQGIRQALGKEATWSGPLVNKRMQEQKQATEDYYGKGINAPAGTLPKYDTSAYVGQGPRRNQKEGLEGRLPVLHDAFNALPKGFGIPTFAGLSVVLYKSIQSVFTKLGASPGFLGGIGNVVSTVLGVVFENIFTAADKKAFIETLLSGFRSIFNFAQQQLFGGGKADWQANPIEIMGTILKIGIGFESFRKMLYSVTGAGFKALPNMGKSVAMMGESKMSEFVAKRSERNLQPMINTQTAAKAAMEAAQSVLKSSQSMSQRLNNLGQAIPPNLANNIIAQGAAVRATTEAYDRVTTQLTPLAKTTATLRANADAMANTLREARGQLKANIIQGGAYVGGAVGGVLGQGYGRQLTETDFFKDKSDTIKLGTETGMAALGAVIGGGVVSAIVLAASYIGTAIAWVFTSAVVGPLLLVVGAIAAAVALIWNWDTIKPVIDEMLAYIADKLSALLSDKFPMIFKKSKESALDTLAKKNTLESARSDLVGAFSNGTPAAIAAESAKVTTASQALANTGQVVVPQMVIRDAKIESVIGFSPMSLESTLSPIMTPIIGFGQVAGDLIRALGTWLVTPMTSQRPTPTGSQTAFPRGATGGFVRGPGTGTSDSILARIANGEFVVNAKSTAANLGLLNSINNGGLPAFAQGGLVQIDPRKKINEIAIQIDPNDRLLAFLEMITKMEAGKWNNIVGNKMAATTFADHPRTVGVTTADGPSTAAGAFQITKTTWDALAKKTDLSGGFTPDNQVKAASQLIKDAGAMGDILAGNFTVAIDKLGKIWASFPSSPYLQGKQGWEKTGKIVEDVAVNLGDGMIATRDTAEGISKYVVATSTQTKQAITEAIKSNNSLTSGMTATSALADKIMAKAQSFATAGMNLFNKMTPNNFAVAGRNARKIAADQLASAGQATPGDIAKEHITAIQDGIQQAIAPMTAGPQISADLESRLKQTKTMAEAAVLINAELGKMSMSALDSTQISKLMETPDNIDKLVTLLNATGMLTDDLAGAGEFFTAKINNSLGSLKKQIELLYKEVGLSDAKTPEGIKPGPAGAAYAENLQKEISTGIIDAFKGTRKPSEILKAISENWSKATFETMITSFTKTFFKAFTDAMGNALGNNETLAGNFGTTAWNWVARLFGGGPKPKTGKPNNIDTPVFNGLMNNADKGLGGMVNLGNSTQTTFTDAAARTADVASASVNSMFSTVGDTFTSAISGFGDGLGSVFESIGKFLMSAWEGLKGLFSGFSGGSSGAGASSGIFSFIGSLFQFADGGVIPGAFGAPMPVLAHGGEIVLNAAQQRNVAMGLTGDGKKSQVFNLNITGDVSRQTRAEIQKMIPQITTGVNAHNYEQGHSSR